MAKKLNITPGLDLDSDDSITRADFTFWFTQALFGGIDREHFASGSSPSVSSGSAPTSPTTGLLWHDTSSGAVSVWTGSEWLGVGLHIGATAPTSTAPLWADTTLNIVRRYWTIDGIEGWHPVDSAYQLMVNRSGGVVEANRVVTRGTTSTSGEREFDTTDTVKSQAVIGVTLESVASTASGVVAMVSGGATVDILADDGEADGAIAKGDGLVTYSVAGECRTVGSLPGDPRASSSKLSTGLPVGCFAEAIGTKDATTHLVRARLLGRVGEGVDLYSATGGATLIGSFTIDGSVQDFDEASFGATTTKHLPVVGVFRSFDVTVGGSTGVFDCELDLQQGGSTFSKLNMQGNNGSGTEASGNLAVQLLPTNGGSGSYDQAGNNWQYTATETTKTFQQLNSRFHGYRY